jgi:hypothetical protein
MFIIFLCQCDRKTRYKFRKYFVDAGNIHSDFEILVHLFLYNSNNKCAYHGINEIFILAIKRYKIVDCSNGNISSNLVL